MKQVCVIHGGSTYDSVEAYLDHLASLELDYTRLLYRPRWNQWLGEALSDWEVLLPSMPNTANAQYDEWSLYFSKIIPFLRDDAVLVGHSLGGIFLAKYLSEHSETLHFHAVILIAAPFNDPTNESLGTFKLSDAIATLHLTADEFYLFHSEDDVVVPVEEVKKYQALLPTAHLTLFKDRNHINTPTFPELVDAIKK